VLKQWKLGGPEHILRYLAAYTHRIAISNRRLLALADGNITFRWRDSAHGNRKRIMSLSVDEFLRRFLLHLLPRGFMRIRNLGFLANAFVLETQTRPCPTFGRPVHRRFPHRLRPGISPQALRIPPHGGHPALRSTASSGCSSALAVSSFRLRARLDVCIPSVLFGQRGITPAFGYGAPHSSARGT
jgi:hypothetical protein